jgi:lipopolysaccharide transport system ATP-binding protein
MTDYLRDELATRSASDQEGEVLVRVENVSKKFCRSLKRSLWYGLQDAATELTGRKSDHALRKDEFWAINNVSFELRRGECLGLIGPNGAGKSTLLKMLNGLIKPDRGRIEIHGRVGALIELGTGFNPVLTGRENIYNNAAVLGLKKTSVDCKLEAIIEFAEVKDFIDMPVQSYSSGMKVRLGFAVAAQLEPDVLIIDEVLAVGDMGFRNKCYSTIDKLISQAAVILVTHNMEAMTRIATKSLVLNSGYNLFEGVPIEASSQYSELFSQDTEILVQEGFDFLGLKIHADGKDDIDKNIINYGDGFGIAISIYAQRPCEDLLLKVNLSTSFGQIAAEFSSKNNNHRVNLATGKNTIYLYLKDVCLSPQKYFISFSLIENRSKHIFWCRNINAIVVKGHQQGHQSYQLRGSCKTSTKS